MVPFATSWFAGCTVRRTLFLSITEEQYTSTLALFAPSKCRCQMEAFQEPMRSTLTSTDEYLGTLYVYLCGGIPCTVSDICSRFHNAYFCAAIAIACRLPIPTSWPPSILVLGRSNSDGAVFIHCRKDYTTYMRVLTSIITLRDQWPPAHDLHRVWKAYSHTACTSHRSIWT